MEHIKMLIANSDPEFQKTEGGIFAGAGFDVSYVKEDGLKLLEKIENTSPDVVLASLFMPNLDGIGVMKSVEKKPSGKKPMFVIISTFTNPNLEREVMMCGRACGTHKAALLHGKDKTGR